MKILVTGANGYLGKGIVDALIKENHHVVATDFSVDRVNNKAEKIPGNIFEIENPFEYYGKPEAILHLAWRDGFIHNSSAHIADLSKHILLLERFFYSDIKKIAVMGTMHEIGFHEGSIDEYTPTNPMNYYGLAKDSLRKFASFMAEETKKELQWLRAYYIVGNSINGSSIFSKIIAADRDGEIKFPFTTGKNQFDFLDYEEFTHRVSIAVTQNKINGIINIASGEPVKLSERVEQFIQENNLKIELQYGAYPDRKYDSKATWGNSLKIDQIIEDYEYNKTKSV